MTHPGMDETQMKRYARHLVLPGIGSDGQERIMSGRVLVVGAGGLGSPVSLYLAAAGVGRIGIVDADCVDMSNLQRQVIHTMADVGRPKVESAREKMLAINPDTRVDALRARLDASNASELIADYDFVVDATDNFASKFLISDTCVASGKPFVYGGVLRFGGQAFTHLPATACLRCVYGGVPPEGTVPRNEEAGVLGAVVGVIGTIQATEALKFLTGAGRLLTDRLLMFDAMTADFRTLAVKRNANCAACGGRD